MYGNLRQTGRSLFGITSEISKTFGDGQSTIFFRRWLRGSRFTKDNRFTKGSSTTENQEEDPSSSREREEFQQPEPPQRHSRVPPSEQPFRNPRPRFDDNSDEQERFPKPHRKDYPYSQQKFQNPRFFKDEKSEDHNQDEFPQHQRQNNYGSQNKREFQKYRNNDRSFEHQGGDDYQEQRQDRQFQKQKFRNETSSEQDQQFENPQRQRQFSSQKQFENRRYQNEGEEIERVITSPRVQEFPDPRFNKKRKGKFVKDHSKYGSDIGGDKISGDPFLTGPYPKTVRKIPFEHGNSAAEESVRRQIDPASTSIILFPGQGSQYVGMCGPPESMPRYIQVLYEIASSIMDVDLLDLCANGPQEKLDKTIYCQPAILVASLAALEKLREENPHAIESCVATAGFSVGEIAALVFSGAITFEDAVRLVKVRAEAMQLASEITPSGMATVMYGADSKLNYSLLVAKEWCTREYNIENPVCSVANYLFPHCKVVAGNKEALEFLQLNYKDFKLRKIKMLPVSGAFHTDIMKPAAAPVKSLLENMEISKPRMPIFSNVTGNRYYSSEDLKRRLPKQIYKPVLWEQAIQNIYQRPKETDYPLTFECGPGSSLSTVLRMVNAKAHLKCKSIQPFQELKESSKSEEVIS